MQWWIGKNVVTWIFLVHGFPEWDQKEELSYLKSFLFFIGRSAAQSSVDWSVVGLPVFVVGWEPTTIFLSLFFSVCVSELQSPNTTTGGEHTHEDEMEGTQVTASSNGSSAAFSSFIYVAKHIIHS